MGHDHSKRISQTRHSDFNPRAHEGYDLDGMGASLLIAISIHVPTRGTTSSRGEKTEERKFQSTYPRGVRPDLVELWAAFPISIHVPTRGTTRLVIRAGYHANYFNPRTHEGYDGCAAPPRLFPADFNPRTHEGYDFRVGISDEAQMISIHVPTRGTTADFNGVEYVSLFQSTYPRGVRQVGR